MSMEAWPVHRYQMAVGVASIRMGLIVENAREPDFHDANALKGLRHRRIVS